MNGKTHAAITGLVLFGISKAVPELINIPTIAAALVSSYAPDCDHSRAPAGRIFPAWIFCKHRTLTHSILTLGVLAIATRLYAPTVTFGVTLGYGLHILADCLTPMGVPILYPLSKKMYHLL